MAKSRVSWGEKVYNGLTLGGMIHEANNLPHSPIQISPKDERYA
jgi:hypothetical protein